MVRANEFVRELPRASVIESAGRTTTTSGSSSGYCSPSGSSGRLRNTAQHGYSPAAVTISGTKCPGAYEGSAPSRTRGRNTQLGVHSPSDVGSSLTKITGQCCSRHSTCYSSEPRDRGEHLLDGVRIDRDHLGCTAQIGQRVVDNADFAAQTAQRSSSEDDIGGQSGPRIALQVVQVVTARQRGGHMNVDPCRSSPVDRR